MSKSGDYLKAKYGSETITPNVIKSVSQYRRGEIEESLQTTYPHSAQSSSYTTATSLKKNAQVSSNGGGYKGTGDSANQVPNVYSPLWLDSNLALPRDRATINAWLRAFYALNPFVHNSINLHSTYPISKLNIKCKNKKIENFFNDMCEEIDLMNVCVQIAQEYWLLGEAFPFVELDEEKLKWSRITILNPDYMILKRTVIEDEPLIMMKPDQNLKTIVTSNKAADIEQRKQLNPYIVNCVLKGQNIPLDNFQVSHLARRISPYENRGTGLPVCIFRQLCLLDKLRECYDEDTEVLTQNGFKKINEILEFTTNQNDKIVGHFNGLNVKLQDDIKIACYDEATDSIKYQSPNNFTLGNYSGEMYHFSGNKVDVKVTPNHKMYFREKLQKNYKGYYSDFQAGSAEYIASKKKYFKFKTLARFEDGITPEYTKVLGTNIPTKLYLKVLGYILSEGCVYQNYDKKRYDNSISISQATDSDCYEDIKNSFNEFGNLLSLKVHNKTSDKTDKNKEKWEGRIGSKDLTNYFIKELSYDLNKKCNSFNKKIPRQVFNYKKEDMKILLDALVKGDGNENVSKYGTDTIGYSYCTVSKQLCEDVYELVYKCGYSPNIVTHLRKTKNDQKEYYVTWSNCSYGDEPILNIGGSLRNKKNNGADVKKVNYEGAVWCFEVPTGYFVTRRNDKITIQGNCKFAQADNMINPLTVVKIGNDNYKPTPDVLESWRQLFEAAQYNKDFKIFTNEAVDISAVGKGAAIYDTSGDVTQLIKEILIGLQVPSVLMDGGSDTTYANGGVALDVLRQRYMQFRNMLASWLKRKIFAPISKMNEFYEYQDKEKVLIIPEVDWNHMSLFDAGDYIQNLVGLTTGGEEGKRVAVQELHRSMGLDYNDQLRKIKKENISNAILKKEQIALDAMTLSELRALTEEDEIQEKEGQQESKAGEEGGGGLPGMPGSDFGPPDLGAPPSPGPSEPPPSPEPPKP